MNNREYLSVQQASVIIATEVLQTGSSKDWSEVDQNNLGIAKDLEKKLREFNIGFTNNNGWSKMKSGSRYFNGLAFWGFAKSKIGAAISAVKSQ